MLYNFAILFPSSVCIIFAVILAIRYKENSKSQNILSLCLLLTSISLFNFVSAINSTNPHTYIIYDMIDAFVCPLVFPVMYLYFRSFTNEKPFSWQDYMLFIPSVIIGTSTLILYIAMGENNATNYTSHFLNGKPLATELNQTIYHIHYFISVKVYNWTILIQTILIGIFAIYNVYRYHSRLKDFYSNLDDKSIILDNKLLIYFLLLCIMAVILTITERHYWAEHPNFAIILFMVVGIIYFGFAYNGTLTQYSASNLANDIQQADLSNIKIESPMFIDDDQDDEKLTKFTRSDKYKRMIVIFTKLMNEDKIFLNSDLRLDEVARLMFTNRNYVSKLIKEEYECSFSDYINKKRIEFSKIIMHSNPDLKQEDIATQSGFSNAQSFSRTFKQIVGIPPKEWYKNTALSQL